MGKSEGNHPLIDIYDIKYDGFWHIPEGAVFDVLDLSWERFTEFPRKLSTLTVRLLDCWGASITSLKGLPKGLKELVCSNTRITSLEGLPQGLKELHCCSTSITSLEGVPRGIKEIWCFGCNNIKYIPDYIPDEVIAGLSEKKIAECKANWRKKHGKELIPEKQKTGIVNRLKNLFVAYSANMTNKVNER